MNYAMRNTAMNAYGKQSLAIEVEAASPHRLILMLFEGAVTACHMGKLHMQNGSVAEKGMAISKAIAIIEEGLRLSLDKEVGGELVNNLDALYAYMGQRLLQANVKNDPALIDEVLGLLTGLKEAWAQIDPARAATSQSAPQPDRSTPLTYGQV
ncbi:flagellar export chaperone FliS [Propionivibrio limicola]|uniref:flagellar export chaperone FliS n=1 Tax=Propionivibrio limicola TaxID=167645 RepID=UPI001290B45A|nr:flagellar export chaperone FliS [Propionivibrio limicola]